MLKPIILFFAPGGKKDYYYEPVPLEDEPLPPDLHPLLIPLVISKITSQLAVNDLLNFRLVCRAWNAEATPILRKRVRHLKIQPSRIRDFLRVYRQCRESPVQSFSFYAESTEHMMMLKAVSESLSHTINSLRLNIASQEIPSLANVLQNFRVLKELVLLRIPEKCLPPAYRKYDTLKDDLVLPQLTSICLGNKCPNLPFICNYDNFVADIINSSGENLKTLEFHNWKSSLQQLFRFTDISSLSTLYLTGTPLRESEMATLRRKRLRLKHLKITLSQNIRDDTLTGFFQSVGETLEALDVASDTSGSNFRIHCYLPHLKELRFQGWKCKIILDDFTANFPELEYVEFLDFEFIAFTDYRRKEKSLVKSLIARPCTEGDELAELNIASLVAAFPSVKRFHGSFFNDSMCDTIFKYWNDLEVLALTSATSLSDFGVTGIPTEILRTTDNVSCLCSSGLLNVKDFRVSNYIGNLAQLKSLTLQGSTLSTASLLYGIFDLKELRYISVEGNAAQSLCHQCVMTQLPHLRQLHINALVDNGKDLERLRSLLPHIQIDMNHNQFKF